MGGRCVASVVLMMVVISACSQPEAVSAPTSPHATPALPSSSSTAGTPSETLPPTATSSVSSDSNPRNFIPTRARAHSADGATAFAELYMSEVARAWMKADGTRLRLLSTPGCRSCNNYVTTADSLASRHEHYASAPAKAFPGIYLPESTPAVAGIHVPVRQLAAKIVSADGSMVKQTREASALSEFRITWTPVGWLVSSIVPAVVN